MQLTQTLKLARQDFWRLKRQHQGPAWAHALLTFALSFAIAGGMLAFAALMSERGATWRWWRENAPPMLVVALCIGAVFHTAYRAIERWAPERFLAWVNGEPTWGVSLFFCITSSALTAMGWGIAMLLLGELPWVQFLRTVTSMGWVSFFAISIFIILVWGWWAWQSWHEEQLKRQAQEAQLRLLQAQIEPHFLFNTLANVRSLIDCDPKQAGELLDAFTDHLRASLTSMRADAVPLGKELELVGHYLKLMQLRMCERLQFSIEADEAARQAMVPPLLLQPLVENAIHHGLECQIEGGYVAVRAKLQNGRLTLTVQDDGVGLNAPKARASTNTHRGNGVATQNIRERLARRYGTNASLQLAPALPKGTVATIEMPATIDTPAAFKAPNPA